MDILPGVLLSHPQHAFSWPSCREAATPVGPPELEAGRQPDTCCVALKRVIVTLHRNAGQGGLTTQKETHLYWPPISLQVPLGLGDGKKEGLMSWERAAWPAPPGPPL